MTNPASATTISAIAALIGDVARANILSALMSGKALTATELAHHAGVSASTTSGHLARLVDGQLIAVERQGRHRYYRLASAAVAEAFESLSNLAAIGPRHHRPTGPNDRAMQHARTCYDHMAGRLAVAMTDALTSRGLIIVEDHSGLITDAGRHFFADFGIDLEPKPRSARPLCRTCLDWSERRMHLGGRLGAALLAQALRRHWLRPIKESRALAITRDGERGIHEVFGVPLDMLASPR
ncbi:helix-turn-helix domain-containing protein [Hoeflea sp.]|uniref:ArsR/SmtB family transcription factor n=1 Tax=Hoeflea sp. TaxID=1940281 RepID=UPI0019BC5DDC|nr:helix-turn-helix domain-containing protein [Hoeflea sp.]MBC7284477.1 helix-turn-helix transcriptional regulator [Hoeflea sp.]